MANLFDRTQRFLTFPGHLAGGKMASVQETRNTGAPPLPPQPPAASAAPSGVAPPPVAAAVAGAPLPAAVPAAASAPPHAPLLELPPSPVR